jgi:hypothetical protein
MSYPLGLCCDTCEDDTIPGCEACALPETIYFWYNYSSGDPLDPDITLVGPIAVAFDTGLGAWITSYPQAFRGQDANENCEPITFADVLYYGQIGVALKPGATDCHAWMQAAQFKCVRATFLCQGAAWPYTTEPTWIASDPGDPLDLADSTPPSPCAAGDQYWYKGDVDIDVSGDPCPNSLYEHPSSFYAWTRTTDPPGI